MANRRNFLKSLGLVGAGFAAPSAMAQAAGGKVPGNTGWVTLRGKVLSGGRGVAGVAVTDGSTVVRTDAAGTYLISAPPAAGFVYISVPAGYYFPVHKGIARFYQPIAARNGLFTADFNLEKLGVDDRRHQFVIWADPQVISEADAAELKTKAAPDLLALVRSYPKGSLFHGIGCGDLVWDHFELYEDYREAVATTGIPFFNVMGNHDMNLDARSDELSSTTYRTEFGPNYYSFNRGEIHYVVLDDIFFLGGSKKCIGYVTEQQLTWLEQDLAALKPGSTVVVCLHIPTNNGAARRDGKEEELWATVQNRTELYRLLSPFRVHLMSGHTHVNELWESGNMTEHVHGTVCGAWWAGPICTDGTPSGYGVYEVDGSTLQWYYKGTGLHRQEQLRIYGRGRDKGHPQQVVANVWNWDEQWKVEWLEDGIEKGAMEQRVGLDPWAVELYQGPELPGKYLFIDPSRTDHLFYATPSQSAKEIVVRATDRFGKQYTAAMRLG